MLGVLLVAGLAARAQEPFDEAVPGAPYEDDFREIVVDTALFYAPLGDESSVFSRISRYGFAFTTYTPRGADDRFQRVGVAGLEFSDELGRYPDYGLYAALAALAPAAARTGGVVDGYYSPLFVDTYEVGASSSPEGMSVTCTYSERRYRGGLRFRAAGSLGRGWYLAGTLRGRWGEDAWMPGVFTEAYMGALSVEKRWREQMSLALFLMAAPQQRGLRGWTEQEVFDLTGNNRYNPYWGPYAGRMRNARVRYDRTPLAVAEWRWQPSERQRYRVACGYRFGVRSRSGLVWTDAASPYPDYYANLPGHCDDPRLADRLAELWRNGDKQVTQIDWRTLYDANLFSGDGEAGYWADRRNERLDNFQLALTGRTGAPLGLGGDYGVRLRLDHSNCYRTVADLLGATYAVNRDPFTGEESDLRHPGRRIGVGDRFDYDYDIRRSEAVAFGSLRYRHGRWHLELGSEVAVATLRRTGRYAKQSRSGASSFGPSEALRFTPWQAFAVGRCNFTPAHRIVLQLHAGGYMPHYEDLFLAPDYFNTTIDRPCLMRAVGASLDYRVPVGWFGELQAAAFVMRTDDETQVIRYYDDMYRTYCDLAVTGIAKRNWGVELGFRAAITDRLSVQVAFATGSYCYAADPRVQIREDATHAVLMEDDRSRMKGFVHTSSPQTTAGVVVQYRTASSWGFSVEGLWADRRYVEPNPLRRTDRVLAGMASPEERLACLRQERLPAAWVVNVGVTKGFDWSGVRVFVSLSIDNLLGLEEIVYGGYEQMRMERRTVGGREVYTPFPSRYGYAYPRTVLASVTVSF